MSMKTQDGYAVRTRSLYYAGTTNADSRWRILETWDNEGYDVVTCWPTREQADAAIPSPVHLGHGEYGRDHKVVKVGSRDWRRAWRNTYGDADLRRTWDDRPRED